MLTWKCTVEVVNKKMKMDVGGMRQVLHKSRKVVAMMIVKPYRRVVMPKYPSSVGIDTYLKVVPACCMKMMILKLSYCYRSCHRDGISRMNKIVGKGILKMMMRMIVMTVTKVKSIVRVAVKAMLILETVGCPLLMWEEWR